LVNRFSSPHGQSYDLFKDLSLYSTSVAIKE